MKQSFVLIGGGEISEKETKELDLEIKSLTGKETPKILFFPVAAQDSQGYIDGFTSYFTSLGFEVSSCKLTQTTKAELLEQLHWADALYFGGGDTEYAMSVLTEMNFKSLITDVLESKDLVISGISAGAMIWCKEILLLDVDEYVDETKTIPGLGLVDIFFVPHFTDSMADSIPSFESKTVYGVTDCAALVIEESVLRTLGNVKEL